MATGQKPCRPLRASLAGCVAAACIATATLDFAVALAASETTSAPAAPANPQARPAAPSVDRGPAAPYGSPFGPPYDTNRPPPVEPPTSGPGITSIKVSVAGAAEVEELRGSDAPALFAVVLDAEIPEASTTAVLDSTSVTATSENGNTTPLFAICAPTAEAPFSVYRRGGGRLARWHVAVGGRTFDCGGRNARMVTREGGVRFVAPAKWAGSVVLLFPKPDSPVKSVTLAGTTTELPREHDEQQEHSEHSEKEKKD